MLPAARGSRDCCGRLRLLPVDTRALPTLLLAPALPPPPPLLLLLPPAGPTAADASGWGCVALWPKPEDAPPLDPLRIACTAEDWGPPPPLLPPLPLRLESGSGGGDASACRRPLEPVPDEEDRDDPPLIICIVPAELRPLVSARGGVPLSSASFTLMPLALPRPLYTAMEGPGFVSPFGPTPPPTPPPLNAPPPLLAKALLIAGAPPLPVASVPPLLAAVYAPDSGAVEADAREEEEGARGGRDRGGGVMKSFCSVAPPLPAVVAAAAAAAS